MADQMDQQCEAEIGNEASGAADILQRALQEAATECFESSSEHSNLERATSNSPPATNDNPLDQTQDLNINKQAPPVGSSQNPIQIIQQGNTYHSTQSLSQEQLQQIAQVLQQQQLVQATQKGGTSVLYNPVTNTRVVYRVIYPGQQNAKGGNLGSSSDKTDGGSRGRGRGRVKKGWGRRSPEEEEKAEGSGPELSREEKEERKKHRPRTRSGRISKPPSYMVKDYKRIHHLDFDEEPYDDSDGGYSDFNVSGASSDDHEEEVNSEDSKSRRLPAGVTTARRRNFKCGTCEKAYIGRGGLARHYRLNPDHGNHDELESDDRSNATIHSADDSNMMDQSLDGAEEQRTNTVSTSRNEEIKLQLSPSLVEAVPESLVSESEKVSIDQQYKREPKCSQRKVDPVHRKARLKGVLHQCNDEEVMEVVMPRLTKVASAWQFLQKKCERGSNLDITKMYSELEDVLKHATKVAQDYLVKPDSQLCSEHLNVTDDHVARALGLTVGTYGIKQSEALEFDLRLPKPRPENEIASESVPVTEPAAKRRRIDDGAETFSLLDDPVCQGSYFIEQKSTVDTDAKEIDEEATDVVIVSEASECTTVNDAEFFGVDPDTSRLSEKKEPDVEEHLQGSNNAEIVTVYATESEADECGLINDVSGAMPGNIPQEMNDDVEEVGEAIEFSSVQESGDLDVEAEISRVCEKDENSRLEESNCTDNDMCTMQVENGDGHMLCDVSGLILPRNLSQQLSEEQTEIVVVSDTPEFTSGKDDSGDLGEDPESSSMCQRKEVEEGNLEFNNNNNNNTDNVVQLEVHTFEHDVCTMEVENEDGDMMADVPCILPGNAVIVSNLSNGECEMTTYQIPDAEVPIETVQALLAMNDAAAGNR